MREIEQRLKAARAERDALRGLFDSRLATLKSGLAERSVGARIADDAKAKAKQGAGKAADVARESKAIIGAAGAALALWFLRKPIAAKWKALRAHNSETPGGDAE